MADVTFADQMTGYGPPTPVPIFQWEPEFTALLDIYRERKPKRVLEIGTYHGGTLYHWLTNAAKGTRVVSVDSYAVGVDNRSVYEQWKPAGVDLQVIWGDSRAPETIANVAKRGPFDWLFIDAGHYYEEVRDDWENYLPLVRKGGLIAFHDILPPSSTWPDIQVAWLWQQIKDIGYQTEEIIHDPKASWGGIGVVYL